LLTRLIRNLLLERTEAILSTIPAQKFERRLNGGPAFKQSEAFSFQVATRDQAETDRYWNAIVGNGGQESACGWCKDRWGLNWQITPIVLTEAIADADPVVAQRAFAAMMTMRKIDVAAIEAAVRG
jgi:2-polyprenyl-6-hydroxyphenyl methylase/3-demethylubiquinone-9 3-methyltransferase